MVVNMSSIFWLLADRSCDLSQELTAKGPINSEDICGIFQLPKKYSVFLSLACWRLLFEFSRAHTLHMQCTSVSVDLRDSLISAS